MIQTILSSKTVNRLLVIFITNPEKRFYIRQLSRMTAKSLRPIQLALAKLTKAGILISEREANLRYYRINKESPIYEDIKNIVLKTEGVGNMLKDGLKALKNIKCAFIYGSLAKDKMSPSSDIDVCIIGKVKMEDLAGIVRRLEEKLKREISTITFTPSEWNKNIKTSKAFVKDIIKNKKIPLLGNIDEIY